jgi:hypothetical protein
MEFDELSCAGGTACFLIFDCYGSPFSRFFFMRLRTVDLFVLTSCRNGCYTISEEIYENGRVAAYVRSLNEGGYSHSSAGGAKPKVTGIAKEGQYRDVLGTESH